MEFEFPLPPVITPSPLSSVASRLNPKSPEANTSGSPGSSGTIESQSSPAGLFNIFHTNAADEDIEEPHSSDLSSTLHPVFINSALHPECRISSEFDEPYPVERLNPVCFGYFNHKEYEASMASILAAEAMLTQKPKSSALPTPTEILADSIQHRRSAGNAPFPAVTDVRTQVVFTLAK